MASLQKMPILPLRNSVLLPTITMPYVVGRPASLAAVEAAVASEDKEILVVSQRQGEADSPQGAGDLYRIGTKGLLRQLQRTGDEIAVVIQGVQRVSLKEVIFGDKMLQAVAEPLPVRIEESSETTALRKQVLEMIEQLTKLTRGQPLALAQALGSEEDPLRVMYTVGALMSGDSKQAQELLEQDSLLGGLRWLYQHLRDELEVAQIQQQLAEEVGATLNQEQREHLLRRQLRAIQKELGEESGEQAEIVELRQQVEAANLPETVGKEVKRELDRLEKLPAMAPEHGVIRSYLEFLLDLPWSQISEAPVNISEARRVLDEDHWGLMDVKERILEHLGVLQLNPQARGPIICLVGAPGVGKTSLGQSVARALGRKFERLSLGGMHDEAELRGHRRTYVGAMPGRILQAIRRVGVRNPLLMLDEVDKLGRDFRGDPAAALLEVLDPEQNATFRDNYLDLPFDLSQVLFITTANTLGTIPGPLLDRMEVVRLPGYTEEEKGQIALRYLWPRQRERAGLADEQLTLAPDAMQTVIRRYTREAGVRQLERSLGRMARKVALQVAEGRIERVAINSATVAELLGPEPFFSDEARLTFPPGVAAGMAWTEQGGEVLYIEAAMLAGRKGLTITGQLGEVMQESARAAETCVWSRASELGLKPALLNDNGLHIHVPAGAIPKDGPSAGITISAALASLYTGRRARPDTAMTGEVTITGLVLPVGGIKEKVLAARRVGIRRVVLPRPNEKDLIELASEAREEMEFIFVERIEQVWDAVLTADGGRP